MDSIIEKVVHTNKTKGKGNKGKISGITPAETEDGEPLCRLCGLEATGETGPIEVYNRNLDFCSLFIYIFFKF